MECLCRSSTVFGDGTFYCVPRPFSQLYTLDGIIKGQTLPLAFGLLPDKSNNIYIKMLKETCHTSAKIMHLLFNPQNVMIDFEQASMQPFLAIFPHAQIKLCLFHFRLLLLRKFQSLGLQSAYNNNYDFLSSSGSIRIKHRLMAMSHNVRCTIGCKFIVF